MYAESQIGEFQLWDEFEMGSFDVFYICLQVVYAKVQKRNKTYRSLVE